MSYILFRNTTAIVATQLMIMKRKVGFDSLDSVPVETGGGSVGASSLSSSFSYTARISMPLPASGITHAQVTPAW